MFKKILVALENGPADQNIIPYITELALFHDAEILLVHVADGWVARNYDDLQLKESEEMKEDRAYLEKIAHDIKGRGLEVSTRLALGNPPEEILETAEKEGNDLIALTSHGHRFLEDILYGSTIDKVRHKSTIPILVVPGNK
jgi:manganese transport protein